MPRPPKVPPMPVRVRINEDSFDMIFSKANVDGPKRAAHITKLVNTLKKISKRRR